MELVKTESSASGFHLFDEEASLPAPKHAEAASALDLHAGRQLVFRMLGQRYSIPLDLVKEVAEYREPTPLPLPRQHIAGYVSFRGEALPLLDRLSLLACEAETAASYQPSKLVILEVRGEACALAVDHLEHIMDLEHRAKQTKQHALLGHQELIQRVTFENGDAILGLDFESLIIGGKGT